MTAAYSLGTGLSFLAIAKWGHGVGLCQMGAIGMARKGASSAEILKLYFPGVEVEELSRVIP